jgi:hypothetical protein
LAENHRTSLCPHFWVLGVWQIGVLVAKAGMKGWFSIEAAAEMERKRIRNG